MRAASAEDALLAVAGTWYGQYVADEQLGHRRMSPSSYIGAVPLLRQQLKGTRNGKSRITWIIWWPFPAIRLRKTLRRRHPGGAFRALGLERWRFLTTDVEPEEIGDAITGLKAMKMRGINCTIPQCWR